MTVLALVLAFVFTLLAGAHVFWGLGGTTGGGSAVPKRADGRPLFTPGPLACFAVAGGLGVFAFVCLAEAGLVGWPLPWLSRRATLAVMAAIFFARTLGDFRYFGLMRRVSTP